MYELVTKVCGSGAPPLIPSAVTVQHDNRHVQMTSNKIDGTNYSAWSHFVKLDVTGNGKLGHMIGEKKQPAISDPFFTTRVEENAMLMLWLLKSMTLYISATFLQLPTAHALWDVVAQTYFDGSDASQIPNLGTKDMRLDNKGIH